MDCIGFNLQESSPICLSIRLPTLYCTSFKYVLIPKDREQPCPLRHVFVFLCGHDLKPGDKKEVTAKNIYTIKGFHESSKLSVSFERETSFLLDV